MRSIALLALCGLALACPAGMAAERDGFRKTTIELPPVGDIRKARFEFWIPKRVAGVLVLVDGENLPATVLTGDEDWRRFAAAHDLAICGPEFASENSLLRLEKGYYDVPAGAGNLLLGALDQAGLKGKPLVMYGISGGARFVNSFVVWKPRLVKTWAAYTVNAWAPPVAGRPLPPGIVACGQYDDSRYWACLDFVQRARKLHQPVAWVSLHQIGHRRYLELEDFAREYFDAVLRPAAGEKALAVDYIKENEVDPREPWQYQLSCELPARRLLASWRALNEP
ncbi:MAG: hypothetical protein PHC88_13070 [Terrimicrobiaceae bacterium]|nr:hypothetical protein [Terrimicrobiaceae bacterium]